MDVRRLLYMLHAPMIKLPSISTSTFFFCQSALTDFNLSAWQQVSNFPWPWLRAEGSVLWRPSSWPPCSRRRLRQWPTRRGLAPGASANTLLRHKRPWGARPPCHRPRRPTLLRPRRRGPRGPSHPKLRPRRRHQHHLAMARRFRRPVPPSLARLRRLCRWSLPW